MWRQVFQITSYWYIVKKPSIGSTGNIIKCMAVLHLHTLPVGRRCGSGEAPIICKKKLTVKF
jgi:hypothetical protein